MIGIALNRTWQQLLHPKFRSVFFTAVIAAILTLVLLNLALYTWWPKDWMSRWEWVNEAGFWAAATIGSYLLFPGIATLVMGLMADQIATAVEEEYYPHRVGQRKTPVSDAIWGSLKLTLAMIVINIVAFIPYLFLFFSTAGTGALALFIAVNGYLLGREYFEMVALRHMSLRDATRLRQYHSGKVFAGGAVAAGLFAVPILNILAPIVAASAMTHIFQFLSDGDTR